MTSTTEARARCSRRKEILQRVTPATHALVLDGWFQFLDGIELPYVHLDAAEFCMLADGMDEHLTASLRAFDLPPSSSLRTNPEWVEMLDVAQIDPDDLPGTVAGYKLAAHQWGHRPVMPGARTNASHSQRDRNQNFIQVTTRQMALGLLKPERVQ